VADWQETDTQGELIARAKIMSAITAITIIAFIDLIEKHLPEIAVLWLCMDNTPIKRIDSYW
jgi:hypothetical protein